MYQAAVIFVSNLNPSTLGLRAKQKKDFVSIEFAFLDSKEWPSGSLTWFSYQLFDKTFQSHCLSQAKEFGL